MHLCTPTLPSSHSSFGHHWESQTPKTKKQTHSQFHLIKNHISTHQGNSPTPILKAVNQLAKNAQSIALKLIIIHNKIHTLQNVNMALAKHQKTKRTHLQKGGALSWKDLKVLLEKKKKKKSKGVLCWILW